MKFSQIPIVVIDLYLEDKLEEISTANVTSHHGMGRSGQRMGRGRRN